MKLAIAKDQSELGTIPLLQRINLTSSERAALVLCDATVQYPWRTIRSRFNGARLLMEQDGKWDFPERTLGSEALGAEHPDWTPDQVYEALDADPFE